jgi:hypothetical protein
MDTMYVDAWAEMAQDVDPVAAAEEARYWALEDRRHETAEAQISAGLAQLMLESEKWEAYQVACAELTHWKTRHAEAMATTRTHADRCEVGRLHDAVTGANKPVLAALAELETAFPDVDPADYLELAA